MTKEDLQAIRQIMQEELEPVKEDIASLKTDVKSLQTGQTKLEVKIENEIDRAIKTIGEGHSILNRKLDEKISLENRVETLEHKMSAVEFAIKKAE